MNGVYASVSLMVLIGLIAVAFGLYFHYHDKHQKPPVSKSPPA